MADTIANCFRNGSFRDVTTSEEPSGSEEPFVSEVDDEIALPEVINGDNYLHVDDGVPCFAEDDYLEDYIVEAVSSKRPRQEDSCECKEENGPDPRWLATLRPGTPRSSSSATSSSMASAKSIMLPSICVLAKYFVKPLLLPDRVRWTDLYYDEHFCTVSALH